ncbi:MAG: dTDP-4-dehydrorhamnose 3,5-epimerase, partial [Anaerolineales bacterium]
MEIRSTAIPDIRLITPQIFTDERGFFMETYQLKAFEAAGIPTDFVQDNHSGSQQGVLRGLHYQIQQPQGKLVRVVTGEVFDVVVDLRQSSETFGKWVGVSLSSENKQMLWVPPGFAHGFYVLSVWADLLYRVTDMYAPEWDRTLRWDDPGLGIEWPLIDGKPPRLSPKDSHGSSLA